MADNCNDCINARNLDDKIAGLWHAVNELKDQNREAEKRITNLERKSDVTDEKFDRIFTALEAIEKNIEKIATAIDSIQSKPGKTFENLKYESLKYIVIAALAAAVAKFF